MEPSDAISGSCVLFELRRATWEYWLCNEAIANANCKNHSRNQLLLLQEYQQLRHNWS